MLKMLRVSSLSVKTVVVDVVDDWLRYDIPERQVPLSHQTDLGARDVVLENN